MNLHFVPSFYDGVGRVSDEKLSEILQDKREVPTVYCYLLYLNGCVIYTMCTIKCSLFILSFFGQKVIGWYKFRRNSQMLVSLRERFVHHNLIEHLKLSPSKGMTSFSVFKVIIIRSISITSVILLIPCSLTCAWKSLLCL